MIGRRVLDRLRQRTSVGEAEIGEGTVCPRECLDGIAPDLITIGRDCIIAPSAMILTHDASLLVHTGKYLVRPVTIGGQCLRRLRRDCHAGCHDRRCGRDRSRCGGHARRSGGGRCGGCSRGSRRQRRGDGREAGSSGPRRAALPDYLRPVAKPGRRASPPDPRTPGPTSASVGQLSRCCAVGAGV